MVGVGGAGRRRVAALTAVLLWGSGCADSHFTSDAEDARRLALLRGDPLTVYLGGPAGCEETPAHYRPSTGEPLDFAAVEPGLILCRPVSGDGFPGLRATAEAAGWTTSAEGGEYQFHKRFGDVWAMAKVGVGFDGSGLYVRLTIPPHSSQGYPPSPRAVADGRACADAVAPGQPPAPGCPPLAS